ncbi:hypothetical protein HIM_07975 [Hirsutella minnesotensis 3608]|uniref:BHLH domain-containing protein n=1 Tax=Hirsutella minnesotensis 3608 TaxID=1043627 RepID=A0A0F7ZHG8_9HYPO|nr:hypothetical protein HIM_07975 [Hirsutella minnesotensis 3608]
MARAVFLPTPSSSTDITGKDGLRQVPALQAPFELPPPAMRDNGVVSHFESMTSSPTHHVSCSSLPSISPEVVHSTHATEALKSPWRAAVAHEPPEATFSLPPPPTRSRKIIQMKPRQHVGNQEASTVQNAPMLSCQEGSASTNKQPSSNTGTDSGRKKQSTTASVAGRKIARKTAHSLIERRRRSKMNEEFAVLKSMIPACTGEMHKLAILQASIDYVRYLEDCVAKLKAQHKESRVYGDSVHDPLPSIRKFHPEVHEEPSIVEAEITDSETPSPAAESHDYRRRTSISPSLRAQATTHHQQTHIFSSSESALHSYSLSAGTSPVIGPQQSGRNMLSSSDLSASTLTSPMLNPQRDSDQEASAALLMLNKDRRDINTRGRGLSVRDLLST